MRVSIVLCLCLAAVLLTGCKTKYYYVDSGVPVGHACPNGDECYGGSFCVEGTCTITCQSPADCWEGTECRPYGDDGAPTCVTVGYQKGDVMVGVGCYFDPVICDGVDPQCDPAFNCNQQCASDDECSPGYHCSVEFLVCTRKLFCNSRQTDDPDAHCTQECGDDRDCPPTFYCENVPSSADPEQKLCTRRKFCAPCTFDSDCDLVGGVCATDQWGVKFCTTECVPPLDPSTVPGLPESCTEDLDRPLADQCRDADPRFRCNYTNWGARTGIRYGTCYDPNVTMCPQPHSECRDSGDGRTLCYHRYGSCVGDGGLCSPCRTRKDCNPDDDVVCWNGNPTSVYSNPYSEERFCTKSCDSDEACGDSASACYRYYCQQDSDCLTPGATCDPVGTRLCSPESPGQCFKAWDSAACREDTTAPYPNPKLPTCYPAAAGPQCIVP